MAKNKRNPLTVVCWLYPGARNYQPRYVNVLYKQVQKHLPIKHRFVCIYDDTAYSAKDFDLGIELMPVPDVARPLLGMKNLGGPMHPPCFARLWHFSDEAAERLPGRVFMFDVDSIPKDDMTHLVRYRANADFITMQRIPSANAGRPHMTGGSWILRSGAFPEVWDDFIADPMQAARDAADWFLNGRDQAIVGWTGGSDQSWMSYRFMALMSKTGRVTYWPDDCGIRLWDHFRKQRGQVDGCLLHFNGPRKPWNLDWPLTNSLYASGLSYRVVKRPLPYGGKRYQVGERVPMKEGNHARALLAMRLIEAV